MAKGSGDARFFSLRTEDTSVRHVTNKLSEKVRKIESERKIINAPDNLPSQSFLCA